ncbi:hypothetical protein SELMODRAFT_405292 [Selaginella moellendorffii]|uniref:Uncharacterized protein n=1 Tax=Selaginella moellendorffii TaxID=88036 RepID=D8QWW1_SELML|nr:hypothetical protein SELMODRAFT_405292 [Selaginella moellendorffii]
MGFVSLKDLVTPDNVLGDKSWKIKELGLPDYWKDPVGFLTGYVSRVIVYSGELEGKRDGDVIFLCGRTPYDMYECLDREMDKNDGPYLLFGVLLSRGFRVTFYRWERPDYGEEVRKDVCDTAFNFNISYEVRDVIGPTIRGMLMEVRTDAENNLKVLKAGVDTRMIPPDEYDLFVNYPDRDVIQSGKQKKVQYSKPLPSYSSHDARDCRSMLLHCRSLRRFEQSGGAEEAESERVYVMTVVQPSVGHEDGPFSTMVVQETTLRSSKSERASRRGRRMGKLPDLPTRTSSA